jgi:hypothetical protein
MKQNNSKQLLVINSIKTVGLGVACKVHMSKYSGANKTCEDVLFLSILSPCKRCLCPVEAVKVAPHIQSGMLYF